MSLLQQSSTAQPLVFLMVDSTDHVTGKTSLTPTVTLSKAGGAFAAAAGAVTEIANGWYKVAGNATDTNTLGPLALHATATGADPVDLLYEVVAFNPQDAVRLGVTALPNAAADAAGGLPISDAGGLDMDAILADTNELQTNQGNWATATGFAVAGDEMDLVDAPNATAVAALQSGLSTLTAQQVWEYVTRELTSAGAGGATAQEVWEYATRELTGKTGFSLAADQSGVTIGTVNALAAGAVASIWNALTSGLSTVGSIGKLLVDNINATISSRSTYDGSDTAGTTTLLSRILGTLAAGTHTAQSGDAYGIVNNGTYGNSALKTLVDDLPTNSELSTALDGADDAVLAAIAALNNLDSAAAQAAAAAALTAYGAATGADVTSATSPLATSSQAESISQAIAALNDLSSADVQSIIDVIAGAGWTDETLVAIRTAIDTIDAGSGGLTVEQAAQLEAAGDMATDFSGMVEVDGAVKRFTSNAVENAPSGAGLTVDQVALLEAIKAKTDIITTGTQVLLVSPVSTSGNVTTYQGAEYLVADGRQLMWADTGSTWPDLSDAEAITLKVLDTDETLEITGTYYAANGEAVAYIVCEVTAVNSAAISAGSHPYQLWADDVILTTGTWISRAS